jgi:diketogulonate reductase-like aldo/keto reductase
VVEIVDFMSSLVADGYISIWGVSNWSIARIEQAISYAR